MAQLSAPPSLASRYSSDEPVAVSYTLEQCIAEAWAQGFNFGSLVILILFVLCNYRRGVLLHKLILLEVRRPNTLLRQGKNTVADLT